MAVECRRRRAVLHQADVVVGGDRRHAQQRLAVRPTVALRQRLLMPKERRASHEEDRERRQTDVRHCIVVVAPRAFALVGQTGADLAQRPDHVRNGAPPALESMIEPADKRKPRYAVESSQKPTTCGISDSGRHTSEQQTRLNRIENRWY